MPSIDPLQMRDQTFVKSAGWNKRENQTNLQQASIKVKRTEEKQLPLPVVEKESVQDAADYNEETPTNRGYEPSSPVQIESTSIEVTPSINQENKAQTNTSMNSDPLNFNVWLERMTSTEVKDDVISKKEKINPVKEHRVKDAQKESIYNINPSASSETLAQLLVNQGYKSEAISMYEKLSLRFPEKKAIFADLIQKLKKN